MRYVAYDQRKRLAGALKPIYRAPTVEAAEAAFAGFKVSSADAVPASSRSGNAAGRSSCPSGRPTETCKVIYTTDEIVKIVTDMGGDQPGDRPKLLASRVSPSQAISPEGQARSRSFVQLGAAAKGSVFTCRRQHRPHPKAGDPAHRGCQYQAGARVPVGLRGSCQRATKTW